MSSLCRLLSIPPMPTAVPSPSYPTTARLIVCKRARQFRQALLFVCVIFRFFFNKSPSLCFLFLFSRQRKKSELGRQTAPILPCFFSIIVFFLVLLLLCLRLPYKCTPVSGEHATQTNSSPVLNERLLSPRPSFPFYFFSWLCSPLAFAPVAFVVL